MPYISLQFLLAKSFYYFISGCGLSLLGMHQIPCGRFLFNVCICFIQHLSEMGISHFLETYGNICTIRGQRLLWLSKVALFYLLNNLAFFKNKHQFLIISPHSSQSSFHRWPHMKVNSLI